jgi:hypothetical protein
MGVDLPKPLKMALTLILERDLQKGISGVFSPARDSEVLEEFFHHSLELGFPLSKKQIQEAIELRIEKALRHMKGYPDPGGLFPALQKVLQICRKFDLPLNLWNIQNSFLDACKDLPREKPELRQLFEALAGEIDIPPEVISWESE